MNLLTTLALLRRVRSSASSCFQAQNIDRNVKVEWKSWPCKISLLVILDSQPQYFRLLSQKKMDEEKNRTFANHFCWVCFFTLHTIHDQSAHTVCGLVQYCLVEVNWKSVGESFRAVTSSFTKMIGFRALWKKKKRQKYTHRSIFWNKSWHHVNVRPNHINICALSEKPVLVMGLKGREWKKEKENIKEPIIFSPQPKSKRSAQLTKPVSRLSFSQQLVSNPDSH